MEEQKLVSSAEPFRLLQLPQDVQLSILLAFDIRELIICRQMCRSLSQLIDDDVSVRYKIELARAGRADGTSSAAVTVVDRLAALLKHRARCRAGGHPLERLHGKPFGSRSAFAANGLVTTVAEGVVHLWRPAGTGTGIGELTFAHSMQQLGLAGVGGTSSCVGDVAQDLLVFTEKIMGTPSVDCFIYSLARGEPHPDASQSRISASVGPGVWPARFRCWDSVQILGDLIAWNIPDTEDKICHMKVINWKTAVTVWESHQHSLHRCHLISESHLVVVTSKSLLIYTFDPDRKSPAPLSPTGAAQCVLRLPAWNSIRHAHDLLVQGHIQFPPCTGTNDHPLFRCDPRRTLLTLAVEYMVTDPEGDPHLVQYAVFVPVSTLVAHFGAVPQDSTTSPARSRQRAVRWEDWGPAGTHVAYFGTSEPCQFSAMGSACAVAQRRRDAVSGGAFLHVLVFDVHRWAVPDPQDPQRADSGGLSLLNEVLRETDPRGDALAGQAFAESVRTTFPVDVTQRDVPVGRDDRFQTVVLGEDGLVLVTAPSV